MGGSEVLPAAVDAQSPLSASELSVLRNQFDSESDKGWVSVQTKFNLAWGCVKSNDKVEVAEGISILMEIYRTDPPRRRECLYFLAVGHYKLGSFDSAKKYTDSLLDKEPRNMQALSLAKLIEKAVAKEGYVGIALAAGVTAIGGILLSVLLKGGSRRH